MKGNRTRKVHARKHFLIYPFLFIFFLIVMARCTKNIPVDEIGKITTSMEEAWRSGNKAKVASYYTDDAYLIHPGGIAAHGRIEVDAYWGGFSAEPVDWNLTSYLITKKPEEVFNLPRFKEGDRKMKLWTEMNIRLPDDPVFQFGQSALTYVQDGKTITSTVEYILVWKKTSEGWRIYIDTYR